MDWNNIESNWDKYRGYIHSNWLELSNIQLDDIGGNRDKLASALQQCYHWSSDEAELHITEWERNFLVDNEAPKPPLNKDSDQGFIDTQNTEESKELIDSVIGSPFHKGY